MRDIFAIICRELAASVADEESTKEAILYLEKFAIYTAGQDFMDATSRVISSLRAVGKAVAKNGLEDATKRTALSLLAVCKAAMENELEAAARQAASALASLSIISKEIVETTISVYESKLRDSDRSTYLKSKKLYEQELEKWK